MEKREIELRKRAIVLWPQFVNEDGSIRDGITSVDIEGYNPNVGIGKYYTLPPIKLSDCKTGEDYKQFFEWDQRETTINNEAFSYLKDRVTTLDMLSKSNSNLAISSWCIFGDIMRNIAGITIVADEDKVLKEQAKDDELYALYTSANDFISKAVKRISVYFANVLKMRDVNEFCIDLIGKLQEANLSLSDVKTKMEESQREFFDSYLDTKVFYSEKFSDLREPAKKKRSYENTALQVCLYFIDLLKDINLAMYYGAFGHKGLPYKIDSETNDIMKSYTKFKNQLEHSPIYFRFLSNDEKRTVSQNKQARLHLID